tara:strand:- start:68 stop:283 length:216 start_codon:yes stop_codon:yes gene_type:complete
MVFERGDKVKVVYGDISFTGLTGIIEFGETDEYGDVAYILTDITYPKMVCKKGYEYKLTKTNFYEDWLKQI